MTVPNLSLSNLPKPSLQAASCRVGLIEVAARHQFGIEALERAWFSHSFVYVPSQSGVGISQDGISLTVDLTNSSYAARHFSEKLLFHYGLELVEHTPHSFAELLPALKNCLGRGVLPVTSFDPAFATGTHAYGRVHQEHFVAPFEITERGIRVTDVNLGEYTVSYEDYEACVEHMNQQDLPVRLATCRRAVQTVAQVNARQLAARDLIEANRNIHSSNANEGLNALRQGLDAIRGVLKDTGQPFLLRNLGRFFRERHSVWLQCPHLQHLLPEREVDITKLHGLSRTASGAWYRLYGAMWRAALERNLSLMARVPEITDRILQVELELADVYSALSRTVALEHEV